MDNFIKLVLEDGTYHILESEIKFVQWYDDPLNAISLICNYGQLYLIPHDYNGDLAPSAEPAYRNEPILSKLVQTWMNTRNHAGLTYINPLSVNTLICKLDGTYVIHFKNGQRMDCSQLNTKANFKI